MTECNTLYTSKNDIFDMVNVIEELKVAIGIAEKMVSSQLVKDSLLTVQNQLSSIDKMINMRDIDTDLCLKLISAIQRIRQNLPEEIVYQDSGQHLACSQSAVQLHLSRSISGHIIKQVRVWYQDHSQWKGLLIYMENLFTALSELATIEDGHYDEQRIVDRVVARCKELLNATETKHHNLFDEAWDIICKARRQANQEGVPVVITLVDQSAEVIMTYRMEDALLVSSDMAYKKAYTAVGMKMQSKDLAPLTQPGQWLFNLETMTDNKVVSLAGGIPIYNGNRIIGAIGVSGGSADQDQKIAEAALQ